MTTVEEQYLLRSIRKDALSFDEMELSSGNKSNYYIDLRRVTLLSESVYLISKIIFDMIKDDYINAVGGMTIGADPIVSSLVMYGHYEHYPIHGFIVRKEPKLHGKGKWIEGNLYKGDRVVIVDDVITSGSSLLKTIDIVKREVECEIVKVIAIVDRMEGGKENLKQNGYDLISLFNKSEIV